MSADDAVNKPKFHHQWLPDRVDVEKGFPMILREQLKKMGYTPALRGQKTTLKQECINDECLASEFDNIFFDVSKINLVSSGIIEFYSSYENLKDARRISDHVPITFQFSLK